MDILTPDELQEISSKEIDVDQNTAIPSAAKKLKLSIENRDTAYHVINDSPAVIRVQNDDSSSNNGNNDYNMMQLQLTHLYSTGKTIFD